MIEKSGIAIFTCDLIGTMRLDDGGLRLVTPFDPDPFNYPKLERIVAGAFAIVDGHHVTTREAYAKLPAAFGLEPSSFNLISLTDEGPIPQPPEGAIS
jgi:hypothetical protein